MVFREDDMRIGRTRSGLIVVADEKRERQERAKKAADDRERLGKMMHDILHMSEVCGAGICCGAPQQSYTKDKIRARRRLWRHFADELLGVGWDCEEFC